MNRILDIIACLILAVFVILAFASLVIVIGFLPTLCIISSSLIITWAFDRTIRKIDKW